jgi:hypothetical protein
VSTYFDDFIRLNTQRIADLKKTTDDLEREILDARVSLERELAESARAEEPAAAHVNGTCQCGSPDDYAEPDTVRFAGAYLAPGPTHDDDPAPAGCPAHTPESRTASLVTHGRRTAYRRGLSRISKIALGTVVGVVLITVLVVIVAQGGASWPSSVAVVQGQIEKACQNPDVRSEPGQVNFTCAKASRQILWVFALLTSRNNPSFTDPNTGRLGLEPITPAQGGEIAASLNLHHPYNPSNPVDSIQVAARALNNIIGGATLIGANGTPVVQNGLEGSAENCRRYTGSATLNSRQGFPALCARALTTDGQAALVRDVYRKWIVGAPAQQAQNAAVLFQNANDPGNPRVQAILKNLSNSKFSP